MKNVDKIISISNCLKHDVMKYLKVPEDKIRVIYNGKDKKFKPMNQTDIDEVRIHIRLNELENALEKAD